jgi:succinate dehydrogenase hydrophobic anchor subunit
MKRWLAQALVAVVLAFLGVVVLRVAMNWGMFGASPYVQYMTWVHNDIPRFYTISVTALSDVSGFAPFRTDLELTYLLK